MKRPAPLAGSSARMMALHQAIDKAARCNGTILIQGETGTGKELVARAIHHHSFRADRPFVAVNCGGIPDTLVESELFGYDQGAFTGASKSRKGRFELADGGTLFLDEIGELPLLAQAKLLRVLQENEIDRIGRAHPIAIDIRVIAATNRDLGRMAAEHNFRPDLYYRLNIFLIHIPPLRQRLDDIPELALHFAHKHGKASGVSGVSDEVVKMLRQYDWPGNVRELENVIQNAVINGASGVIQAKDLRSDFGTATAGLPTADDTLDLELAVRNATRNCCQKALRIARGSITGAARLLHLHRSTLYRMLREFDLAADCTDWEGLPGLGNA